MNQEILDLIKRKGLLLEKGILDALTELEDKKLVETFLDSAQRITGQKIITASILNKNFEFIHEFVSASSDKKIVERVFIKMGLNLELKKETQITKEEKNENKYGVFYHGAKSEKKIDVSDFVDHFRARYQELQGILMQRQNVESLMSISKIPGNRQKLSIIGIVNEKKVTANKNLMVTFEDMTGKIKVLFKKDSDCYKKAEELQLDDIVLVTGSGTKEIIFAFDLFYPDSYKEKVNFKEDYSIAFISDIHAGSKKHLSAQFTKFIDWINSDDEGAKKIRYLFIVGDNVDGVGVFPGQENLIALKSFHEQYDLLYSYLSKVPKSITMFMCPGQHDCVRVAEPQPILSKGYAAKMYEIPNLVLVPNPSLIKLYEEGKEFKVLMYHGASIHTFINEIGELRLMKAHKCPAKAVKHMLKRRHLAPMHGVSTSIVYVPNKTKDPLVISEVPDILCTGEVHRLDIENYNGTIIITGSCWQAQTEFEEKVGNVPDPCKVPIFNLKSRELRVLDFGDENEQ